MLSELIYVRLGWRYTKILIKTPEFRSTDEQQPHTLGCKEHFFCMPRVDVTLFR